MPFRIVVPLWKTAPFIRLLLPVVTGIAVQHYLSLRITYLFGGWLSLLFSFMVFQLLSLRLHYRLRWFNGCTLNLLLCFTGMLLTWCKDIRHQSNWLGKLYRDSACLVVRLAEPPVAKAKTNRAEAIAEWIIQDGQVQPAEGRIILYFERDSTLAPLYYGDRILLRKSLQPIQNTGNRGEFDYAAYCAFRQVHHSAWLRRGDYIRLGAHGGNAFRHWLLRCRENILGLLRRTVPGEDERAIAEALLIGYREDLDRALVQAYSNTGVVHIIAISGLHLAMVYWLLTHLVNGLPLIKRQKGIKAVVILTGLWLFALLTGGSASVLRSAVMFTGIVVGEGMGRKTSIYNSLAASALLLLVYDPFLLWDVGFQLSYLAVLGIVLFQYRLYCLVYIKWRWPGYLWKMATVSLSAQVLTFPVCLYYFHQLPLLFLFANLIAVPVSGVALFAEIALVLLGWWPWAATWLGKGVGLLLLLLNRVVVQLNNLPGAVWTDIPATVLSTVLLYVVVALTAGWLWYKRPAWLLAALGCVIAFLLLHDWYRWTSFCQQRLIVYNTPRYRAIDFASGNDYCFIGDSSLQQKGSLTGNRLRAARAALQLRQEMDKTAILQQRGACIAFGNKKIILVDSGFIAMGLPTRLKVDIAVLSGNSRVGIADLQQILDCSTYVFDASNSLWKISQWKKECDGLLLRCHSVAGEGAFIADVSL